MSILGKLLTLCAVLAISACTNATSYDDTNSANLNSGATGVPGSATDPTSIAYFQQTVGDRILFAVDQSTLSDEGRTALQGQADWLSANTDYTAVIEGHADEQGTREYNLALGARRANAAREFLVSRGVAGNRLKVVSFGKERPIEICSDENCYSKNRRAVTILTSGLTG
ncbi:MAG: peptidoglycan-associated lipoprotein [Paracoccaceae bacterium]|jgi:peptidoglycan-associated lipoprotein